MGVLRYVALLRGINVGGRNRVAMADLRDAFAAEGYGEVKTYIQSGNVLFESDGDQRSSEGAIEAMLALRLGVDVTVVVRSRRQLGNIVRHSPDGFGEDAETYHSDVVFLKAPLTAAGAMRVVEIREGVDRVWPGAGVLYFSRLSSKRSQSKLGLLAGTPEYQLMTIRNWRTTTKLLGLLDDW